MSPFWKLIISLATATAVFVLPYSPHVQSAVVRINETLRNHWLRLWIALGIDRQPATRENLINTVAGISLIVGSLIGNLELVLFSCACIALPWLLARRLEAKNRQKWEAELPSTLGAWADILVANPNLSASLESLSNQLECPISDVFAGAAREVRLGVSIGDALETAAVRLDSRGFDAAVGATLLAHRTGGGHGAILQEISNCLQESARLEGVVKTKTAEGRSQAWVLGLAPPALLLALDLIDPTWSAPLWDDPVGWTMLSIAALAEIVAIALIRKIMAVDV